MMQSMVAAPAAPERSLAQRMDALERANEIRSYRAAMKRELRARRFTAGEVLLADDEKLATMKVVDLLLATPKVGRVKASRLLGRSRISPTKTVGGLSLRQRRELAALLGGR